MIRAGWRSAPEATQALHCRVRGAVVIQEVWMRDRTETAMPEVTMH